MIKKEVTVKGITYTVRGNTQKDIAIAVKALKRLTKTKYTNSSGLSEIQRSLKNL